MFEVERMQEVGPQEINSDEACESCGADIGPSTSFPWHWGDEDCRAIQEPITQTDIHKAESILRIREKYIREGEKS